MSLTYIPGNVLSYQALKSDLTSGSKITGAIYKGAKVYFTDTQEWYRVLDDLTIVPATGESVSGVSGNVSTVAPLVVPDVTYNGQITISSSSIAVSGSTLNVPNRNGFIMKAHPSNAGVVWYGATAGSLSGSAGAYPLSVGETGFFSGSNLNMLDYRVSGAATGILCWMKD